MKNVWRGICVAIFVVGVVSIFQAQKRNAAGFTLANQSSNVSDSEPAQAFVVEYVDSSVSADGTVTVTGTTTRYVKADGEWRLILRRNNGLTASSESSRETVYGGTSDGVFEKETNSASRRYVSQSSDQNILRLFRSHNYLRNSRDFIRTDEVAGLKVYVLRGVADIANPSQWQERSYSPKTGLTILRSVLHMTDGSEIRREAVSVEFKEVPEDLNQDLKNLPIHKEKKIQ